MALYSCAGSQARRTRAPNLLYHGLAKPTGRRKVVAFSLDGTMQNKKITGSSTTSTSYEMHQRCTHIAATFSIVLGTLCGCAPIYSAPTNIRTHPLKQRAGAPQVKIGLRARKTAALWLAYTSKRSTSEGQQAKEVNLTPTLARQIDPANDKVKSAPIPPWVNKRWQQLKAREQAQSVPVPASRPRVTIRPASGDFFSSLWLELVDVQGAMAIRHPSLPCPRAAAKLNEQHGTWRRAPARLHWMYYAGAAVSVGLSAFLYYDGTRHTQSRDALQANPYAAGDPSRAAALVPGHIFAGTAAILGGIGLASTLRGRGRMERTVGRAPSDYELWTEPCRPNESVTVRAKTLDFTVGKFRISWPIVDSAEQTPAGNNTRTLGIIRPNTFNLSIRDGLHSDMDPDNPHEATSSVSRLNMASELLRNHGIPLLRKPNTQIDQVSLSTELRYTPAAGPKNGSRSKSLTIGAARTLRPKTTKMTSLLRAMVSALIAQVSTKHVFAYEKEEPRIVGKPDEQGYGLRGTISFQCRIFEARDAKEAVKLFPEVLQYCVTETSKRARRSGSPWQRNRAKITQKVASTQSSAACSKVCKPDPKVRLRVYSAGRKRNRTVFKRYRIVPDSTPRQRGGITDLQWALNIDSDDWIEQTKGLRIDPTFWTDKAMLGAVDGILRRGLRLRALTSSLTWTTIKSRTSKKNKEQLILAAYRHPLTQLAKDIARSTLAANAPCLKQACDDDTLPTAQMPATRTFLAKKYACTRNSRDELCKSLTSIDETERKARKLSEEAQRKVELKETQKRQRASAAANRRATSARKASCKSKCRSACRGNSDCIASCVASKCK